MLRFVRIILENLTEICREKIILNCTWSYYNQNSFTKIVLMFFIRF